MQGLSVQWVSYSKWKLSGCSYLGASFLGGNCLGWGGNCPGTIILGENCPGGDCPRWQLTGGQFSRGQLSWGELCCSPKNEFIHTYFSRLTFGILEIRNRVTKPSYAK